MSQGPPPTPPQQTPPIVSPFPGSLTPGWNDPPSVQYNSQASSTSGRTKLNKRVPFPFSMQQNSPSAKPTAIVHAMPCQIAPTGACGNIAVVHPMQSNAYANQATSMHFPTLTTSVAPTTSVCTLARDSSQTPPPPPSSSSSTTASASGNLPTMSVAAVPRQNSTSSSDYIAIASSSTASAVQHI